MVVGGEKEKREEKEKRDEKEMEDMSVERELRGMGVSTVEAGAHALTVLHRAQQAEARRNVPPFRGNTLGFASLQLATFCPGVSITALHRVLSNNRARLLLLNQKEEEDSNRPRATPIEQDILRLKIQILISLIEQRGGKAGFDSLDLSFLQKQEREREEEELKREGRGRGGETGRQEREEEREKRRKTNDRLRMGTLTPFDVTVSKDTSKAITRAVKEKKDIQAAVKRSDKPLLNSRSPKPKTSSNPRNLPPSDGNRSQRKKKVLDDSREGKELWSEAAAKANSQTKRGNRKTDESNGDSGRSNLNNDKSGVGIGIGIELGRKGVDTGVVTRKSQRIQTKRKRSYGSDVDLDLDLDLKQIEGRAKEKEMVNFANKPKTSLPKEKGKEKGKGKDEVKGKRMEVQCPICQRDIPVRDVLFPDADLSLHIDECLGNSSRATSNIKTKTKTQTKTKTRDDGSESESCEIVDLLSSSGEEDNDNMYINPEEERPNARNFQFFGGKVNKKPSQEKIGHDNGINGDNNNDNVASKGTEGMRITKGGKVLRKILPKATNDDWMDVESEPEATNGEEEYEDEGGEEEYEEYDEDTKVSTVSKANADPKTISQGGKQKVSPTLASDDFHEEDFVRRLTDWEDRQNDDDTDNINSAGNDLAVETEYLDEEGNLVFDTGRFFLNNRIAKKLFWYQKTGLRWMWQLYNHGAGGILGDEMGLGKTVQVASYLGGMYTSELLDSAIIMAPATVLCHWVSELHKWAPQLRIILFHSSGEAYNSVPSAKHRRFLEKVISMEGIVVVTTYEVMRKYSEELGSHKWTYVILDEGHKIRNPDAHVTLTAKRFQTTNRLILSGTPIQNNLKELWSLFDFVFPGRLGTLPAFDIEFATPIRLGGFSNASAMQVQMAYRCAIVLKELIAPYLLRRMKKDITEVAKMPEKTEQVLFCKLTEAQRRLYIDVLESDEVKDIIYRKRKPFRAITLLRKICNHCDMVDDTGTVLGGTNKDEDGYMDDHSDGEDLDLDMVAIDKNKSGKLNVLAKILPLWFKQDHRVLLFSQTRKMLTILEKYVLLNQWSYFRIDGNTPIVNRQHIIDQFNTDTSIFILLLTTKTGGIGVNLTGADRVVIFDPDWNPQVDIQARERSWRLGQKKPVTIYRLVTVGTIEEKIYQRQIFKTAVTNKVLADPKQRRMFSSKELSDLFTLADDGQGRTDGRTLTSDALRGGIVTLNSSESIKTKTTNESGTLEHNAHIVEASNGDDTATAVEGEDVLNELGGEGYIREMATTTNERSREQAGNNEGEAAEDNKGDGKILKAVLETSAIFEDHNISSVFSHDFVEMQSDFERWKVMEAEAKAVAEKALTSLMKSSDEVERARRETSNTFVPTWTGRNGLNSSQTSQPIFGRRHSHNAIFTNASNPNHISPNLSGGMAVMGSSDLLSRIRNRNNPEASSSLSRSHGRNDNDSGNNLTEEERKSATLLNEITDFFKGNKGRGGGVLSKNLLKHFKHVPEKDAILFRALLRQIAVCKDGLWKLKQPDGSG